MRSTTQDTPLTLTRLLVHGMRAHATSTVTTWRGTARGAVPDRRDFRTVGTRATRLANALRDALGVRPGDTVATLMANTADHLEAQLAVPAMGAVLHPLGAPAGDPLAAPRDPALLAAVLDDGAARVLLTDATGLPSLASALPWLRQTAHLEHVVVAGDTTAPGTPVVTGGTEYGVTVHHYETLIDDRPDHCPWPSTDERDAAVLCHIGPATAPGAPAEQRGAEKPEVRGRPGERATAREADRAREPREPRELRKPRELRGLRELRELREQGLSGAGGGELRAVAFSHRALYLHALYAQAPQAYGLTEEDVVLPVVPLSHMLAWGLPYAAFASGASLLLPGAFGRPPALAVAAERERPTLLVAEPPVWHGLADELAGRPRDLTSLREAVIAAHPGTEPQRAGLAGVLTRLLGARVACAWGVPEVLAPACVARAEEGGYRFPAPVEYGVTGPDLAPLPWDGRSAGELLLRGPWVTARCTGGPAPAPDGWLRTGETATIAPDGRVTLRPAHQAAAEGA
ncbi:AMP-binding protein [Streptomyces cacaoi]|uniref:AMP-binding protein n=1 Tax=Streptomyces cacaoi TaxID=1898 RepID=UPI003747DCA1